MDTQKILNSISADTRIPITELRGKSWSEVFGEPGELEDGGPIEKILPYIRKELTPPVELEFEVDPPTLKD